ncbi:TolC family protein [Halomonas taeanensis]|nr:TolC family protein [Halomonas taeanensis]
MRAPLIIVSTNCSKKYLLSSGGCRCRHLKAAQADTGVRSAGHYPELNLNVSYSDRASNDPFRESQDAAASLQLAVPIYQGGYTTADVRQSELTVKARQAAVTNEPNLVRQEARKRLRSLQGDVRQLDALQQSIQSSRFFLEAAEKGEQLGMRDLVDVLDARAELYDLRIQFVEALCQYLLDDLNLHASVGELGTPDLVDAMALLVRITGEGDMSQIPDVTRPSRFEANG